jgi:cytochrome b pre-mRNA-processing protein 3
MTETYVAYGACDALVKECARQADYTIPQALEKRGVIPKTKDGEDLGVGSGPWYEGKLYSTFLSCPPFAPFAPLLSTTCRRTKILSSS